MKRDLELVRDLLLWMEEQPTASVGNKAPVIPNRSDEEVGFHFYLMWQAGLIAAAATTGLGPPSAAPLHITWAGYEFLSSTNDPTVWENVKKKVLKPGASWSFSVLSELLKEEIKSGFPTLQKIGS